MSDCSDRQIYKICPTGRSRGDSATTGTRESKPDQSRSSERLESTSVTIGYFDDSALAAVLTPGAQGDRCSAIWTSLDIACTHTISELGVPSTVGRSIQRMAWIWTLNSISVIGHSEETQSMAIDLAWLGAPPIVALHVATAMVSQVDHFVSADPIAQSWAALRDLDVVFL